jgi:hypothetical protein
MSTVGVAVLFILVAASMLPARAQAAPTFTFVPDPTQPSQPAASRLVSVADLTGSGAPDLIFTSPQNGTVAVMHGNGAGGFGQPIAIPVVGRPLTVQVADFNSDGHPDLLVEIETKATPRAPNPVAEAVEILFGDGKGNFTAGPQVRLAEAGYVVVGDFTGNGNADAVVVPGCIIGADSSTVYELLGDGHGNLTAGPSTSSRTKACMYQVGDFNRDGRADLVTYSPGYVGETGNVLVLPGKPGGGFDPPIVTPAPAGSGDLVRGAADLDGNGTLDLVTQMFTEPGTFAILSANGAGGFSVSPSYPSGQPNLDSSYVLGDFGGHGRVDIATVGRAGITPLENSGGVFSPGLSVPIVDSGVEAFAADVNGDGRPDLILSGLSSTSVYLSEPVVERVTLAASVKVSHRTNRGRRSLRLTGRLHLQSNVAPNSDLCTGQVQITLSRRRSTLTLKTVRLTPACTFSATITISARQLLSKPALTISFGGNTHLIATSLHTRI